MKLISLKNPKLYTAVAQRLCSLILEPFFDHVSRSYKFGCRTTVNRMRDIKIQTKSLSRETADNGILMF